MSYRSVDTSAGGISVPDGIIRPVAGPAREILQGGTRLLWGPGDRLRLLSKLGISCKKKNHWLTFIRNISEFYTIIYLNKLKIVENIKKQIKK